MRRSFGIIAPVVLWLTIFLVVPMIAVFAVSFMQRDELGNVVFTFTLEHYARFLTRSIWAFTGIRYGSRL